MKNYVYIYFNQSAMSGPPKPEVTKAWMDWFGKFGDNLVDAGNPFNAGGKAVEKSGITTIENHPATGYSIVKANSLDEAADMAKDCPVLEQPGGAVRVYETLPM